MFDYNCQYEALKYFSFLAIWANVAENIRFVGTFENLRRLEIM